VLPRRRSTRAIRHGDRGLDLVEVGGEDLLERGAAVLESG
jgi:hypothetical protein